MYWRCAIGSAENYGGSEGRTGAFLLGFVMGGLVGMGIGMLQAPHSGEETWQMIEDRVRRLEEQADEMGDRLSEGVEQVQEKVEQTVKEGSEKA